MSSEWPIVEVDKVCELIVDCVNKTAPIAVDVTPYRMIRTTNVRNGRISLAECRYVERETYEKWTRRAKLQHGDVVLTREAPIGEVGMVTDAEGIFLGQRLMQYRANRQLLDSRFLLYSFLSPSLQRQFGSHEGSGSVVSHIRVGDCFKFKLALPPLSIQRDIATLLGSLDDRITLLRETNASLEAIAQAIFKSWLVDFDPVRAKMEDRLPEGMDEATAALFSDGFDESEFGLVPKGWQVGTLSNIISESTKRVGSTRAQVLSAVQTGHLVKSAEHFTKRVHSENISNYKLVEPLAFAYNPSRINIGSIGFNEFETRGAVSPIYVVVEPTNSANGYFLWHHLRTSRFKEAIKSMASGTVRQSLSCRDFLSIRLVLPPQLVLEAFNDVRKTLYLGHESNLRQIESLTEIRDSTLPRLISGHVRIREAQAEIEEMVA